MSEKQYHSLTREELLEQIEQLNSRLAQLESDDHRENLAEVLPERHARHGTKFRIFSNVLASMMVAAAAVILIVQFAFPVVRIYGSSMSSTLVDGDVVIAHKTTNLVKGDICVFSFGNRMICKRVIGLGGDVISIDENGIVSVNGEVLDEPYLKSQNLGDCEIEFPYTVPDDTYFVLGDNRRNSVDSRSKLIGCISEEQIVGKLVFCVLPFPSFGKIG